MPVIRFVFDYRLDDRLRDGLLLTRFLGWVQLTASYGTETAGRIQEDQTCEAKTYESCLVWRRCLRLH